jgi:FHA domain-containing protein
MGAIREIATGQTRVLEPEHFVGRMSAPKCSQTLSHPQVSGLHAVLRWTGQGWELKDLNSTNGTYLDGRRIHPTGALKVGKGSRIGFGSRAEQWEIVDAGAPEVMAIPLDGGDPARLDGEMIPLPSSDDPSATIYHTLDGGWVLEQSDEPVMPIVNAQVFDAVGRLWRFCCSDLSQTTLAAASSRTGLAEIDVEQVHLSFEVSRDEEYVHIQATHRGRPIDLGARAFHYLLLTLARRRIDDAKEGFPDTSCGWIDVDELARDPSMAPPRLNIDVFRIRKQFERAGLLDAPKIIERRPRPRQLRIGTRSLSISVL